MQGQCLGRYEIKVCLSNKQIHDDRNQLRYLEKRSKTINTLEFDTQG